jgi:hypothetical protein
VNAAFYLEKNIANGVVGTYLTTRHIRPPPRHGRHDELFLPFDTSCDFGNDASNSLYLSGANPKNSTNRVLSRNPVSIPPTTTAQVTDARDSICQPLPISVWRDGHLLYHTQLPTFVISDEHRLSLLSLFELHHNMYYTSTKDTGAKEIPLESSIYDLGFFCLS